MIANNERTKKRTRSRHVTFSSEEEEDHQESYPSPTTTTMDMELLWYGQSELAAFKKDVANTLLYGGENPVDLIGLERHLDLKRWKAKKRHVRNIVRYYQDLHQHRQHHGSDDYMVSILSQHQSRFAKTIAYGQGLQDYESVYWNNDDEKTHDDGNVVLSSSEIIRSFRKSLLLQPQQQQPSSTKKRKHVCQDEINEVTVIPKDEEETDVNHKRRKTFPLV